jgi:hypothetical protein
MNKGLSTIAFGIVLLAGFIFRMAPGNGLQSDEQNTSTSEPATKRVSGQGPWMASCKYWANAQTADSDDKDGSSTIAAGLHQTRKATESQVKTPSASDDICLHSSDGWGIPQGADTSEYTHKPEISTIIATIPDPIHGHLALDFDRSVDAILLAAADNRYLASYYWLPWRSSASSLSSGEATSGSEPGDSNSTRELQPGLIILRYSPDPAEWPNDGDRFSSASYNRVIYLFLVGETPALGVNGTQLQNAFSYEKFLKDNYHAWLSIRPSPFAQLPTQTIQPKTPSNCKTQKEPTNELSIIGPFFSGSAASLHEGIEAAKCDLNPLTVSISGITGTNVAARELDPHDEHIYRSFGENAVFEQERFVQALASNGYDLNRVALLSEAGTAFGAATKSPCRPDSDKDPCKSQHGNVLYLRFPRELSLLRNAQTSQSASGTSSPPTPYLNFSLKDYAADDTVPRFSTTQSPLSIEAQLMAIAHQLQRARTQFILFSASNILDDIFLAQFLHRACPDARLVVFSGGDLLFERDVDNTPYIGSISISPYLLSYLNSESQTQWLHSDYQAEAIYNAASYAFWDKTVDPWPKLGGYSHYLAHGLEHNSPARFMQIPLWASVVGADGYYPLGVLNWCGSNLQSILPTIRLQNPRAPATAKCDEKQLASLAGVGSDKAANPGSGGKPVWDFVPESISRDSGISPSLLWMVLNAFILILCMLHIAMLWSAHFWSPATRDLAIDQNDQPRRRSVLLNIGTSVLAAMAFVMAYPLILVGHYYHLAFPGHLFAWLTIVAASLTCIFTIARTWRYVFDKRCLEYSFFNIVAGLALLFTVAFWIIICNGNAYHSYAGLYFSYRCLQPLSGVCPLLPILLLLFAWYLWSICQTARLRFSDIHRPRIARSFDTSPYDPTDAPYPLFVPGDALERCGHPIDCCLYRNMTCLLITCEVISRFCVHLKENSWSTAHSVAAWVRKNITPTLAVIYLSLFVLCIFASHIHSLDRFLFTPILAPIFTRMGPRFGTHYGPTCYEFLITALFFPLVMVALSGWFRTILIWGSLSRGLLEPLERLPIRFAFTRLNGGSWVSMLNQSGLHIRWRDMSRSTESIRQLIHDPEMLTKSLSLQRRMSLEYMGINEQIKKLMVRIQGAPMNEAAPLALEESDCPPAKLWDLPDTPAAYDICLIYSIEKRYAEFCSTLLEYILVPYWNLQRTGLVEESSSTSGADDKSKPEGTEGSEQSGSSFIHHAEELIVVRYVALIRAVLVNIRYLMLFVSAAFVLTIIAWNSYPFQPHRLVDWCFTFLFLFIGTGFIWVLAQMHRNPILSRITDTTPNKLGVDFFIRIVTFGAIPVLTWLAYQFPEIGGTLFKVIQPGLQVIK